MRFPLILIGLLIVTTSAATALTTWEIQHGEYILREGTYSDLREFRDFIDYDIFPWIENSRDFRKYQDDEPDAVIYRYPVQTYYPVGTRYPTYTYQRYRTTTYRPARVVTPTYYHMNAYQYRPTYDRYRYPYYYDGHAFSGHYSLRHHYP